MVEVWAGPIDSEQPGEIVFDGKLLTTDAGVVVGSSITDALHHLPMPAGWHRVRIHADPADSPPGWSWCSPATMPPASSPTRRSR